MQSQSSIKQQDEPLTLTRKLAAKRLSISEDTFKRHIEPHLRVIRLGYGQRTTTLVPVVEIERWVREQACL